MGFLEIGQPLTWIETNEIKARIKHDGLAQLLHIYHQNRLRTDRELKWGEELEFTLVHFDHDRQEAQVCIDGPKILEQLELKERTHSWDAHAVLGRTGSARCPILRETVWHPEFGRHMIEATPNPPYDMTVDSLLDIEDSMVSRRFKLQSVLPENVYATSLTAFPRLGLEGFLWSDEDAAIPPHTKADRNQSCGMSIFIPDAMICPHPRFPTLVRNITTRRQCRSVMFVPVFKDSHTEESAVWDKALPETSVGIDSPGATPRAAISRREIAARSTATINPVKNYIFMDHFGFGMGMSCLQMTFGAPSLSSARFLYDQLAVLAPLFLALSAATPTLRGFLSDWDARWKVLEQGCDDRTESELRDLHRTRYGAVSLYVSEEAPDSLNDVTVPVFEPGLNQLIEGGMDSKLARHFASLWVRDPLVVFGEKITLDNSTAVDHFENIQSTNWNSVRFKPPPPGGKIGWRVELRTCDLQLSDFENAALAAFSNLLAMAVLRHHWTFYVPISHTHENMDTAHLRDAVKKHTFWFPNKIYTNDDESTDDSRDGRDSRDGHDDSDSVSCRSSSKSDSSPRIASSIKMTMREIFLGSRRTGFEGLIPMLDKFVSSEWRAGRASRSGVERYRIYANFIRLRVLGQAPSNAATLRHFVQSHPAYEADSIVSPVINYDLCKLAVMTGFAIKPLGVSLGVASGVSTSTHLATTMSSSTQSQLTTTTMSSPRRPAISPLANIPFLRQLLRLPSQVDLSLQRIRSTSSWDNSIDTIMPCRCSQKEEEVSTTPQAAHL